MTGVVGEFIQYCDCYVIIEQSVKLSACKQSRQTLFEPYFIDN